MATRGHSLMIRRPSASPSSFANHQSKTRPTSPDAYSDVIIEVDGVGFAVQKALLCARSGHIKKLVEHCEGPGPLKFMLPNLPGGAQAFKLAVKFCYEIEFEINALNIAVLRCVAAYLEMTEEYGIDNLVALTELFLREAVFNSLKECVRVLCSCGSILSQAEDVKLTSRCIDAIASIICGFDAKQNNVVLRGKSKQGSAFLSANLDWWVLELLPLPIDFFKQVIQAMKLRELQAASIGEALMHYACKALKPFSLDPLEAIIHKEEQQDQIMVFEHGQRIVLETIVNLLPAERGSVPIAFLFSLVRTGFLLDTTIACRMELEKRIGAQLEHVTLEELLVPSFLSHTGDTVFDVDFVHRLVVHFVQQDTLDNSSLFCHSVHESNGFNSPSSQITVVKVAKLLDSYMAEVAADPNLKVTKFIDLMELLPNHARVLDDGIYRAIDIYLKAHPTITDIEKRKICKMIDFQKLSQEACSHAAQNERLPVHVILQVLYMEQLRLRTALSSSSTKGEPRHTFLPSQRMRGGSATHPREDYASLRQENEDLRLEVARMRSRLKSMGKKPSANTHCVMEKTSSSVKKLLSSVSRTFSRINPFAKSSFEDQSSKQQQPQAWAPRKRRFSIS